MLAQNKLVIPFYDTNFLKKISEVPTNIRKDDYFRIELLKFIDEDSSKFNSKSIIIYLHLGPATHPTRLLRVPFFTLLTL